MRNDTVWVARTARYTTIWRNEDTGRMWTGAIEATSHEDAVRKSQDWCKSSASIWVLLGVCREASGEMAVGFEVRKVVVALTVSDEGLKV